MKRLLVVLVVPVLSMSCAKSEVQESDATAPTVSISVRQADGGYVEATQADLVSGGTVDLTALVEDPEGARSITLDFLGATSDSCIVGSTVVKGSFPVKPFPEGQEHDIDPDDDGKVLQQWPLVAQVEDVSCQPLGGKAGRPIGHTITVRATGRNWSADSSKSTVTKELKVHVK